MLGELGGWDHIGVIWKSPQRKARGHGAGKSPQRSEGAAAAAHWQVNIKKPDLTVGYKASMHTQQIHSASTPGAVFVRIRSPDLASSYWGVFPTGSPKGRNPVSDNTAFSSASRLLG